MTDPKNINRLSSHTYELPAYVITENGAEDAGVHPIYFCKGNRDNPKEGQIGIFTESLIELCKIHLESVNQGDLKNPYTTAAIDLLDAALDKLELRKRDRQDRGVFQTYQK